MRTLLTAGLSALALLSTPAAPAARVDRQLAIVKRIAPAKAVPPSEAARSAYLLVYL